MTSASLALTRALVVALRSDIALKARINGVYDTPPPSAALPYLTLGPDLVTDWSTKSRVGREHRLRLTVWEAPLASARCAETMASVEAVLAALAPDIEGYRLVSLVFVRSAIGAETEAGPIRGTLEFRARTLAA